jgi:putative ABC transport system ATP-binding protein
LPRPSAETPALIRTSKLVKVYRADGVTVEAVRGVDIEVAIGEFVAVMGPSGSGKSTLLHLVGGMDRPDSGSIWADDEDLTAMSSRELVGYRRTVGFVFQSFALLPALTARDNVMLPVLPYRSGKQDLVRAGELLADVGLAGREDAVPSQLSGGQRQRVAIARALMGEPRLLVADEPTGNLDSTTGGEIVDLLFDLRASRGLTIVIGTHDEPLASRCDTTVRLRDGRVGATAPGA